MVQNIRYKSAGDRAIVVEYGNEISETVNKKVRALSYLLDREPLEAVIEVVPTYRSLMVHYDPLISDENSMIQMLQEKERRLGNLELPPPIVTEIPTLYGSEYGPDLEKVAKHCGLSKEEVIAIHSSTEYLIYMIGFTPGFPYLGGMDPRIATPRLENPRTKISKGSVGIADTQTGIYSVDSPGGWKLIGWTPVPLFDPEASHPFLLNAGDYVKFRAIEELEYHRIKEKMAEGKYNCRTYPKKQ